MSDTRPRRWDHYVREMLGACDKITSYNEGLDQPAFVADGHLCTDLGMDSSRECAGCDRYDTARRLP